MSYVDANPFTHPFLILVIHLFKTNSGGHRAQFDILPEDFLPKSSRLPYPFMETLGIEHLDLEVPRELLIKVSLTIPTLMLLDS